MELEDWSSETNVCEIAESKRWKIDVISTLDATATALLWKEIADPLNCVIEAAAETEAAAAAIVLLEVLLVPWLDVWLADED